MAPSWSATSKRATTARRGGIVCAAALASAWASAAAAQQVTPFADLRLRYEAVDVEPGQEAEALTWRVRAGLEAELAAQSSLLVEIEAVGEAGDHESGPGLRPRLIPDRTMLEVNRAQFTQRWGDWRAVAGRQRIEIDDERFVGSAGFRQNEQTFDAVRLSGGAGPASLDVAYVWQVNRAGATQTVKPRWESASWLAHGSVQTPLGRIGAYRYALDLAETAGPLTELRNASRTTGVGLQGGARRGDLRLEWRFDYARQTDYADNPVDYAADYVRARLTLDADPVALTAGVERLGSGGARAFQTPLGSNHAFQGSADLFLATPPVGVEDVFLQAVGRRPALGPLRNVALTVRRHRFRDGEGESRLGDEWDVAATGSWRGYRLSLEHASYRSSGFGADTRRTWLTLARSF